MYAVEASSMAVHCAKLVSANGLSDKVTVIAGKVEEVGVVSYRKYSNNKAGGLANIQCCDCDLV